MAKFALEVPEAAIEKAAIRVAGMFAGDEGQWRGYWNVARAAVEAAAPLIVAAAIEQEADRIHGTIQAWGYGPNDDPPPNSIAGALCCVSVELRERASVLRGEGDPK